MKLDILAVGAHPDDVELGCGGTLAKEIANGKNVGVIDLTRGELGTRGSAAIRDKESTKAGEILGLKARENMGFKDGFFIDDKAHKMALIKKIRHYQPQVVLCNAIEDRHIDHGRGSTLTSAACFLSGLRRIKTEYQGKEQEKWRPHQVLHYIQWRDLQPDIVIDISGFIDKKLEAVKAYHSQFYDPESQEPSTPISDSNFFESVKYRARDLGRLVFTEYGEGFTMERYPAVNSVFDLV